MTNIDSSTPSTDKVLTGVALMLGFCLTAPLLDVAAKLASSSVPVGQITAARFIVQCALMAPFIGFMRLSLHVPLEQWIPLIFRAFLLLFATFCFITAIRVMPLADALAIVFVAPFIVLLVGKFYLGEDVGPRRIGACLVGFVGVLFVIQPSFAAFGAVALIPLGTAVRMSSSCDSVSRKIQRQRATARLFPLAKPDQVIQSRSPGPKAIRVCKTGWRSGRYEIAGPRDVSGVTALASQECTKRKRLPYQAELTPPHQTLRSWVGSRTKHRKILQGTPQYGAGQRLRPGKIYRITAQ